jgi:REP element-mobilizing transposase RayT
MAIHPLYSPSNLHPAYGLRYTWTGWLRSDETPNGDLLESLRASWESDGLRLLEYRSTDRQFQLAFSTRPDVSPVFLAGRAKGRLQHALSKSGAGFSGFSRAVAVRSVGHNRREEVERYIRQQVTREQFIDERFRSQMERFTICCPEVDLTQPSLTERGRYWYDLHLVLVVVERFRIREVRQLGMIRDGCLRIAQKKGHVISTLAVMPDHLHVALRGNPTQSPQDIALGFQNNLAYLLGQVPIWQESFYVGTFGEYDMGAIRKHAQGRQDERP